ncbi:MAG: PilZ domain-containing protein [Thermodesulfobacteriota bacterium]
MDLQEAMRKNFRINVKGNSDISVKINDAKYEVFDVTDNGIGIIFSPEDILIAVDDELPIELTIKETSHNLQGLVVHISPQGPEEFLCGIKFIDIDKNSKEILMQYLQTCKEKIFKEE